MPKFLIFDGNFEGVEKTKYCLVEGYSSVIRDEKHGRDIYRTDFIQALGTYNSMIKAFGYAYLYLSDQIIDSGKEEKWHVSAPYKLNDDNGYGMCIEKDNDETYDKYRNTFDWVYILWDQTYKEENIE